MSDHTTRSIIEEIAASLDIPNSAYEKAETRYKDVGEYFDGPDAKCAPFSPHIYPQGSFRLGTVVRPLSDRCEYDLDLGCRLRQGITKHSHTQQQLKTLVGIDLEAYRKARRIEEKLEEKNRCWRLLTRTSSDFTSIPFHQFRKTTLQNLSSSLRCSKRGQSTRLPKR